VADGQNEGTKKRLVFSLGGSIILFIENNTLDAPRYQSRGRLRKRGYRQAALSSPICKRGRHTPTPTHPKVRQSGSPVATGTKKDETEDVVAEANNANARASESPSYPQNPMPLGMGRFRETTKSRQTGICVL